MPIEGCGCSNPRSGASARAAGSCAVTPCPGTKGKKKLKDACKGCKCTRKVCKCEQEAQQINDAIVKAWNYNHGKGSNHSSDNIGGYLCWDWSKAFAEAARSVKAKCWTVKDDMVKKQGSSVVHFFVELRAHCKSGTKGVRYVDDGWFTTSKFWHTPVWPPPTVWNRGTWRPTSVGSAHPAYTSPPIKGVPP